MFINRGSLFKFRGSEKSVKDKQAKYLRFFDGCDCVLDIGCGRGEFIELLQAKGIKAIGIDTDEEAIKVCQAKGLVAHLDNENSFLKNKIDTFNGIFVSHVIEHLQPLVAANFLKTCHNSLKKGGKIVLITPNPENPIVMLNSFWLDPTHERPYPLALLEQGLIDHNFTVIEKGLDQQSKIDNDVYSIGAFLKRRLFNFLFGKNSIAFDIFIAAAK